MNFMHSQLTTQSESDSIINMETDSFKNLSPNHLTSKTKQKRKTIIDEVEKVEVSLKRVKIAAVDMDKYQMAQEFHYNQICDKLSDFDATKKTVEQLTIEKEKISKELEENKKQQEKDYQLNGTIPVNLSQKSLIEQKNTELENDLIKITSLLEEQKETLQLEAEKQNQTLKKDLANALAEIDKFKVARTALATANHHIEEMENKNQKWKNALLDAINEKFQEKDKEIEDIKKHWAKASQYFQPNEKNVIEDDDSFLDSVSMISKKTKKSFQSYNSSNTYFERDYSQFSNDPHEYDEITRKIPRCKIQNQQWVDWLSDENKMKHQHLMNWLSSEQQQMNFDFQLIQAKKFFNKYTTIKNSGIRYCIHNLVADFIYDEFKITLAKKADCENFPLNTIHHSQSQLKAYIRYLQNFMLARSKQGRFLKDLHQNEKEKI